MPTTTVDTEVVRNAVQLACRAPSLHNSQPWQWVAEADQLQLYLDRSRAMLSDRSAREALISCGAALDHLQVAMAAAGWRSIVDRFPSPNDTDHLASIRFAPMEYVSESHLRRASAIWARRTDRLPFSSPLEWESIQPALREALEGKHVHLNVIADDVRPQLADASRLAESLRAYDSAYHAELGWWTAPYEVSEGIPRSALVSAAEGERVDVRRVFPATRHRERRPQVPEDHSMIVVLSTDSDSAADALTSGEALSAVLLECTLAGLATCPVTHITEVRASRDLVGALLGDDTIPQVLIRVGEAPAMEEVPPPTPRRPLDEVLRVKS